MSSIISVSNLSKAYRIGKKADRADSFVGMLQDSVTAPFRNWHRMRQPTGESLDPADELHWALRDVSFEVKEGEVLGVIGRNGAGKSTLLKILSRITEPTSGEVRIKGRVASLLEVGTGFHPELTGRENVYLNGTILGMHRHEIDQKFDEIVNFSGVEKFLDTPVKRYSSGMKVRLAFAVAAHLDPEILIVDEVLAVGDVEFQRKCIGKMRSVTQSGRTILFVTHDLNSLKNLATRVVEMHSGSIVRSGLPELVISRYVESQNLLSSIDISRRVDRTGTGACKIQSINIRSLDKGKAIIQSGDDIEITVNLFFPKERCHIDLVAISCFTVDGLKLFHIDTSQSRRFRNSAFLASSITFRIPKLPLPAGMYYLNSMILVGSTESDHLQSAACFEICDGDFFDISATSNPVGGVMLLENEPYCEL